MRGGNKMLHGRKVKTKDSNVSLLSFSKTKKETGTSEVSTMAKKVIEKLGYIASQHKEFIEKSQKQLYANASSNKEDKLCELFELINFHKILMNRSQLGMYDANFLLHSSDLTDTLESQRDKLRNEAKRFALENKDLKTKLTYLVNRLIEMEGNLAKSKEEVLHWESLSKIKLFDGENTESMESEVWENAIHPDSKDPVIPSELREVQDMINDGNVSSAVRVVKQYAQAKKGKNTGDDAGVMCLLAKRCTEENNYTTAVEIIDLAINFRKEFREPNHPYIAHTLTAKAIIVGKTKNLHNASKCAFEALQIMETYYKADKNNRHLGRQYMTSGFFLSLWGFPEDGIKLMELGLLTFESLLPAEEVAWMDTIVKIARACNDCKFYNDTMTICSELIDYFHEKIYGPISKKNQPIYEIAVECQKADSSTAKLIALSGPKPTYLPPLVAATIREIIIAYSARYEFGAARIMENYLNDCQKLDDPDVINSLYVEGDTNKEAKQSIAIRRIARQNHSNNKKGILSLKESKINPKAIEEKINKAGK